MAAELWLLAEWLVAAMSGWAIALAACELFGMRNTGCEEPTYRVRPERQPGISSIAAGEANAPTAF